MKARKKGYYYPGCPSTARNKKCLNHLRLTDILVSYRLVIVSRSDKILLVINWLKVGSTRRIQTLLGKNVGKILEMESSTFYALFYHSLDGSSFSVNIAIAMCFRMCFIMKTLQRRNLNILQNFANTNVCLPLLMTGTLPSNWYQIINNKLLSIMTGRIFVLVTDFLFVRTN